MTILRLLADDLTGALDTAAEFAGLCGDVSVAWDGRAPSGPGISLALDTGTREATPHDAVGAVAAVVPRLFDGTIAYKKVDSLLRGPWPAELATCWSSRWWRHCVLAPAFPYQGRRTRNGRQETLRPDGAWSQVGPEPIAALRAVGLAALPWLPGQALPVGIAVADAETDADLARIVADARSADGPVLWCGSGGLAAALAEGRRPPTATRLDTPVLGLFGSDQAVTAAQLAACGPCHVAIVPGESDPSDVLRRLDADGVALVSVAVPARTGRDEAAGRIAEAFAGLVRGLDPPGTLIVAGGETLRAVCRALGAESLRVVGRIMPGVPRSVIVGGRWDGVALVSKSGAFGPPGLWRDLLAANGLLHDRIDA